MNLLNSNSGDPLFRIMDLHKCYLFMDLHNWVMDIHESDYGIHKSNYGDPLIELRRSIDWIMEIHKSNYGDTSFRNIQKLNMETHK